MHDLIKYLTPFEQTHVLRYWDILTPREKERLQKQILDIDFALLRQLYDRYQHAQPLASRHFSPIIPIQTASLSSIDKEEATVKGEFLLHSGKVGLVLVAGGQGTRLGFDGPKGCFPLFPNQTLFHGFAEQIHALNRKYELKLIWAIMTSPATNNATRMFFETQHYFGLSPNEILFFEQGTIPSLDLQGRLLLDAPDHIAENPNGHGGTLMALHGSGVLDIFRQRGVESIFYFQVDNPLVKIADPLFLGLHTIANAEMSTKVVPKTDPNERVGVVGLIDEKVGVIEYSELPDAKAQERDDQGRLAYRAANTAIHVIQREFIEAHSSPADSLPYHIAIKKIPYLNARKELINPDNANGLKFEMFIFDALSFARKTTTVEVNRDSEFAPLKNAFGADSPETVRQAIKRLDRSLTM